VGSFRPAPVQAGVTPSVHRVGDVAPGAVARDGPQAPALSSALEPTTATEQLTGEIELLAPAPVGGAATRLLVAVVALGRYAHSADRDLRHMIEPLVAFNEVVVVVYTVERNRFLVATKTELGTVKAS